MDQLTWLSRITLEQELSKNGKADQVQVQIGSHVGPSMPDLSALSPHLQMDWHPDNNVLLGGKGVKPQKDLLRGNSHGNFSSVH